MNNRPCIERLVFIATLLRQGELCKVSKIADRFEVSQKTIHRDIEFLRRLRYEIAFDRSIHSWKLLDAPDPVL